MNRLPDKDVEQAETTTGEPVGKVVSDSRGHNVWQWARDVIESTSVLLKRLENKDLALEPTQKVPVVQDDTRTPRAQKTGKPDAKLTAKTGEKAPAATPRHPALQRERRRDDGGFDPYNSR
jgi:hypothetical protein